MCWDRMDRISALPIWFMICVGKIEFTGSFSRDVVIVLKSRIQQTKNPTNLINNLLILARGFDEYATLQSAMFTGKLSNEILLLPRTLLATGNDVNNGQIIELRSCSKFKFFSLIERVTL